MRRSTSGDRASATVVAGIAAACLTALAGCALAGCGANPKAAEADEPVMSRAKLRSVVAADAIISQGERDVDEGERIMAKDPVVAARLIEEGRRVIAEGEAMKARAAATPDWPATSRSGGAPTKLPSR